MTILVSGQNGFLGRELIKLGAKPFHGIAHKGDVVINCLAKTDHNECEVAPVNAWNSNVEFLTDLLWSARTNDFRVIHVSTDYVFMGEKACAYAEDDPISPVNSVYARTKAAAEVAFTALAPLNSSMVRTSWLFGPNRKPFYEYEKVWIQIGTPTYTPDLAEVLIMIALSHETVPRILHYATCDSMMREDVARVAGHINFNLVDRPAGKPFNSALKTSDWILDRHSRPTLKECIDELRSSEEVLVSDVSRQPGFLDPSPIA